MSTPSTNFTNENALLEQGKFGATGKTRTADDSAKRAQEKELATIRARLCHCGGQVLHVAIDGAFFVVTPWQQITKFNDLQALQAYVAKVGA